MRTGRILGLALLVMLGACARSPMATPDVEARFDGGLTYGGGNNAAMGEECRGGLTYGGGNNVAPVPCEP